MSADISDSATVLAEGGRFSSLLSEYQPRSGQQAMSSLIEQAIRDKNTIVVEAPSGAGKTFAYLVPALIMGKKTIISTATQYLQHQLYRHDIPLVQQALGSHRNVAVLKGRNNYLCPYYLEKTLNNGYVLMSKSVRLQLTTLWHRFRESSTGHWVELFPALDSAAVPYATCSAEACLGQSCPHVLRCPLIRARERANQADIIIVNHSLLFSDQVMRREQFADLLPDAEVVIVDEAHRLAEFAQTLVGHWLSSSQLKRYGRDAIDTVTQCAPDQKVVRDFLQQFETVVNQLCKALPITPVYDRNQHSGIVEQLLKALMQLSTWLKSASQRAQALRELEIRNGLLIEKMRKIASSQGVCWVESTAHGFVLRNIPVNLSVLTRTLFDQAAASWVFTSATLSVAGNADKFLHYLGLTAEHYHSVSSDIDYANNAGLYTPLLSVEPKHPSYPQQLADSVVELLQLIQGRVLFLFTSHAMLQTMAKLLSGVSRQPIFVQGTASNDQLIAQFKQAEEGVLLGTGNFWEGLDLSGAPLSAVIIDKLPFASPADPLVQLRSNDLMINGVDSFEHYLLPDAVIRLRQGCGRLLRRLSDKGVIMIADPRLHSKSYGAVFIDSLPAMYTSRHLASLREFLQPQSIV